MRSSRTGAAGRGTQYWFPCPRSLGETSIAGLALPLPHRLACPSAGLWTLPRPHPPAHPWGSCPSMAASVTPQSTASWRRWPVTRSPPGPGCAVVQMERKRKLWVSRGGQPSQRPGAPTIHRASTPYRPCPTLDRGPGMDSCSDGGPGAPQGTHGHGAGGERPTRRGPVPGSTWRNIGVPQSHSHRDWGTHSQKDDPSSHLLRRWPCFSRRL